MTLYAKQLNHGRSEIWVDEGPHRDTATNNVIHAVRRHCSVEEYDAYYSSLNEAMGNVVELTAGDGIIAELGLN